MPKFLTLDDIDVRGKRVLLRADLNVPVKDGKVTDATRIERLAPTIEALLGKGAAVVVMSHFGRPKGRPDPELSLRPVIAPLRQALGGREIAFAEDCIGEPAEQVVAALEPGEVALLENLRFHPGEEANSPDFARALGRARRGLCRRRLFGGASRARLDRGARASAAGRRRQADGGRARGAVGGARTPGAPGAGADRRRQGLDQARPACALSSARSMCWRSAGRWRTPCSMPRASAVGRSLCERDMARATPARLLALAAERRLPRDPARGRRRRRRAVGRGARRGPSRSTRSAAT